MRFLLILLLALTTLPAMAMTPVLAPAKFQAESGAPTSFQFQDTSKNVLTLDPYLGMGRVLIVNFWATWCPPCVAEMPSLDRLSAALPQDKYKVITIAMQDETAEVSGFLKRQSLKNLTPYMDAAMMGMRAYGVRGLPTTIIISGNGHILGRVQGDMDWASPDNVAWIKSLN